jgi:release factor glutamine methyltransferase
MQDQLFSVQGKVIYHWRENAIATAKINQIDPEEIDWLLLEISNLDRLSLRLNSYGDGREVCLKIPFHQLEELWQKRIKNRSPIQYLAGSTPWRNFSIKVSPSVLIPRPETELIVDILAEITPPSLRGGHWVDLGTGSGILALSLGTIFPDATIHAVDYSVEALAIAEENAKNLHLRDRINFYQGSWWEPLTHLRGKVSGMVSNPPYIPTDELPQLQPEVYYHEPHLALDGGPDGLNSIRHLINTSPEYLVNGGIWLIEMMKGQGIAVGNLLRDSGKYRGIKIIDDLAKADRFALGFHQING